MKLYKTVALAFISVLPLANITLAVVQWTSVPQNPGTATFSLAAIDQAGPGDHWEDDWRTITLYKNGVYLASETGYADWIGIDIQTTAGVHTQFAAEGDGYITAIVNPDVTPPSVPANLAASNQTETSFTLSWSASTDNYILTGYQVKVGSTVLGTTSGVTWAVSGLQAGTHQVSVRAVDSIGLTSAWSTALSVVLPDLTSPTAPTNLVYTSITPNFHCLSWTAAADAVGVASYKVYRMQNGVINQIGITPTLSFCDLYVNPGSVYTYYIRAFDAAGNFSALSNGVVISTPNAADSDSDGIPDGLEALFGSQANPSPSTDTNLQLKTHRPHQ